MDNIVEMKQHDQRFDGDKIKSFISAILGHDKFSLQYFNEDGDLIQYISESISYQERLIMHHTSQQTLNLDFPIQ